MFFGARLLLWKPHKFTHPHQTDHIDTQRDAEWKNWIPAGCFFGTPELVKAVYI